MERGIGSLNNSSWARIRCIVCVQQPSFAWPSSVSLWLSNAPKPKLRRSCKIKSHPFYHVSFCETIHFAINLIMVQPSACGPGTSATQEVLNIAFETPSPRKHSVIYPGRGTATLTACLSRHAAQVGTKGFADEHYWCPMPYKAKTLHGTALLFK